VYADKANAPNSGRCSGESVDDRSGGRRRLRRMVGRGAAAAAQVYAGVGARRIALHEREHGLYVQSEGEKQNDASSCPFEPTRP
jgi:hypothetical protein